MSHDFDNFEEDEDYYLLDLNIFSESEIKTLTELMLDNAFKFFTEIRANYSEPVVIHKDSDLFCVIYDYIKLIEKINTFNSNEFYPK